MQARPRLQTSESCRNYVGIARALADGVFAVGNLEIQKQWRNEEIMLNVLTSSQNSRVRATRTCLMSRRRAQ